MNVKLAAVMIYGLLVGAVLFLTMMAFAYSPILTAISFSEAWPLYVLMLGGWLASAWLYVRDGQRKPRERATFN